MKRIGGLCAAIKERIGAGILNIPAPGVQQRKTVVPNVYIDTRPIQKVALTTDKPLPIARIIDCYARTWAGESDVIGCLLPVPRGATFADGVPLLGAGLIPVSLEYFKDAGASKPVPLAMRYFDEQGHPYPWMLCILPEGINESALAYSLLVESVQTQESQQCHDPFCPEDEQVVDTWGIDRMTDRGYQDCLWRQHVRNQGIIN